MGLRDARVVKTAAGLAGVAAATAVMDAAHANHTIAALIYVVVVVGASFLGPVPVTVVVVAAFASENYFFTPPRGSLRINSADDVVALFVFGISAAVVSATVTRVNELRRRARVRELEARARLELMEQLLNGERPDTVVDAAERTMVELFALRACTIDPTTGRAELVAGSRLLAPAERELIDAFATGIATSVDRVRLDQEASRARVDAAISQSRAAFLSAMTHNLRTPLASIKAAVSTLRSTGTHLDPEDRDELLTTAASETERLERLVTKVLNLSRIRSGTIVLQPEPVDVGELARGSLRSLRTLTTDRAIRLEADPDLPLVDADPTLLDVALSCLLENALRYAPDDREIVVRASVDDDGLELAVVDHGPGVPAAERARVFDEFVRGEGASDATGAGLGLTIARAFVEGHGGTLTVKETPGGGATFVIRIPTLHGRRAA